MGKKETRKPANDGFSAPAQNKTAREKKADNAANRKTVISAVCVILVIALCIGVTVYTKIADSGYFYRTTISVKSDNYEVNNAMMSYFLNVNYQQMSSSLSQMGVDTKTSLKEQNYPYSTGMTWFDYFMKNVTVPRVENMLVLCEAAKAAGFELDEHEQSHVEESMQSLEESLKSYSKQYGGAEGYYLRNIYGYGVTLADVRAALEISQLASAYSAHLIEQYEYSESDWSAYLEENRKDYLKIDYLSYTFKAEEETTESETTAATAAPETETAAPETSVSGSSSDSTDTEVTTEAPAEERSEAKQLAYNTAAMFAEEIRANYNQPEDSAGKVFFTEFVKRYAETYIYDDVTDETEKSEKVLSVVDGIEHTAVSSDETNEFIKYAFSDERSDSVYVVDNDSTGEYTVYYITKEPYIEEYATKNVRMIALSAANGESLSDRVSAVIEEFESGDKSETSFAALAEKYSDDSTAHENGGLYENQGRGDSGIDELDTWIYADERKAGDYSQFSNGKTGTSEITYIVYYVGDGLIKWQRDVDNDMTSAAYDEDYKKLAEQYKVTTDYTELYKIPSQAGV